MYGALSPVRGRHRAKAVRCSSDHGQSTSKPVARPRPGALRTINWPVELPGGLLWMLCVLLRTEVLLSRAVMVAWGTCRSMAWGVAMWRSQQPRATVIRVSGSSTQRRSSSAHQHTQPADGQAELGLLLLKLVFFLKYYT